MREHLGSRSTGKMVTEAVDVMREHLGSTSTRKMVTEATVTLHTPPGWADLEASSDGRPPGAKIETKNLTCESKSNHHYIIKCSVNRISEN